VSWVEQYKDSIPKTQEDWGKRIYALGGIISRAAHLTKVGDRVLEPGVGLGVMSAELAAKGRVVISMDTDEGILEIARQVADFRFRMPVHDKAVAPISLNCNVLSVGQLFPRKHFRLAVNQGVFEHFKNDDLVIQAFEQCFIVAEFLIFAVPNDKYGRQSYGDERLLPNEHWNELVRKAGGIIEEEKIYGDGMNYLAVVKAS